MDVGLSVLVLEVHLQHGCTCRLSSWLPQVMLTKKAGWQRLQADLPMYKVPVGQ